MVDLLAPQNQAIPGELPYPPRRGRTNLDKTIARLVAALRCAVYEARDRMAVLAGARSLLARFRAVRVAVEQMDDGRRRREGLRSLAGLARSVARALEDEELGIAARETAWTLGHEALLRFGLWLDRERNTPPRRIELFERRPRVVPGEG